MKLSDKILNLRKQRGLSQGELAEKLNVSRQAVSRWEVGSAQPDASNVLQLSKLFGVTADYLLNDDYEEDRNAPTVKKYGGCRKQEIKKMIAACVSAFGLAGSGIIYILSRCIAVMVPYITYDEYGTKLYHWSSDVTKRSYKYFIQEYELEFLVALLWGLFFAGLIYLFVSSGKMKQAVVKYKEKRRKKEKADVDRDEP